MCVTAAPAALASTVVYAHCLPSGRHVLGYANTAINLSDGPNMMLLHVPTSSLHPDALVDTSNAPNVLNDMVTALRPRSLSRATMGASGGSVYVIAYGIYTVVMADQASLIPSALHQVPPSRRPRIDQRQLDLLDWYDQLWPDWSFMACCFNNRDARRATPILLSYDPLWPGLLFAPGIDCHTGGIPDLDSHVHRDHWVIWGDPNGSPVSYDLTPQGGDVRSLLADRVTGQLLFGAMPNVDFSTTVP